MRTTQVKVAASTLLFVCVQTNFSSTKQTTRPRVRHCSTCFSAGAMSRFRVLSGVFIGYLIAVSRPLQTILIYIAFALPEEKNRVLPTRRNFVHGKEQEVTPHARARALHTLPYVFKPTYCYFRLSCYLTL